MDSEEDTAFFFILCEYFSGQNKPKIKKRNRKIWVKTWLLNRATESAYHSIFAELSMHDKEEFRRYLRMNTASYEILLEKIRPYITKKETRFRKPISAEEKLVVTLRFLATGESYASLQYQYRINRSTIALFIPTVCEAIYTVLAPIYMKIPDTKEEWNEIINNTYERWNFPNAFAAADGKHVGILCPNNSGSEFYNYKGFFSIVLLAFVDYNYRFMVAEVGCQGRISDGGVYQNSNMCKALTQIYCEFFNGAGQVPWQWEAINK